MDIAAQKSSKIEKTYTQVAEMKDGVTLGEIALINNLKRTAMIKSIRPTLVASLDAGGFRKHAESFHQDKPRNCAVSSEYPSTLNVAYERLFQFSSVFTKRKLKMSSFANRVLMRLIKFLW